MFFYQLPNVSSYPPFAMPTQHLQKTDIQPPRVDERAPAPQEMQGLELAVSGWMATEDGPETARVLTLRFVIPGNEKATFELSVSSDSTIASLKSKCHSALVGPRDAAAAEGGEEAKEETGAKETKEATEAGTTPPHRFLYKGRELSVSSSTVESYNLEDGHTVHLIPAPGTTIAAPPAATAAAAAATTNAPTATASPTRLPLAEGSLDAQEFCCPITQSVMLDPVMAADGFVYERKAIERWIATPVYTYYDYYDSSAKSPVTGVAMSSKTVTPCRPLKHAIEAIMSAAAATTRTRLQGDASPRRRQQDQQCQTGDSVESGEVKSALSTAPPGFGLVDPDGLVEQWVEDQSARTCLIIISPLGLTYLYHLPPPPRVAWLTNSSLPTHSPPPFAAYPPRPPIP